MARFGVLTAGAALVAHVARCLPPEHRIEAHRADDRHRSVDLLIEGPCMPVVAGEVEPPRIDLVMTMHQDDAASPAIRLSGTIHLRDDCTYPRPSLADWDIGRWPSIDAFAQWRAEAF